jgi:uncharacterized protein (PEP-CTERM system associated)
MIMAMAMADARAGAIAVRKKVLQRRAANAGNGSSRFPTRVACISGVLFALLGQPVWPQYAVPGSVGGGQRGGEIVPTPSDDPRRGGRGLRAGQREWEIHPTLSIQETYTDNLRLRPEGAAQSDWVTRLRPGISLRRTGARARFSASYAPELVYRAREESRDLYHYLSARGNAELVEEFLFIDASTSVTQQNVSLSGPQAENNVNVTENRTSVRSYSLSPYLRRDFGHDARGELRFTRSEVSYSANNLFSSEANRIDMRLWSGPAFKLLTWNLAYNKQRIDYAQNQQSTDLERISAGGKRLITPQLGLLANIGYENNDYVTLGPEPKGSFWSVGPEWTPTPRTHLSATTGRRYFGSSHALDFSHRTRLTTWRVNYNEDITTARDQILVPGTADTAAYLDTLFLSRIPDPAARQTAVENFISQNGLPPSLAVPLNFVTTTPFLQKRLQASFGIQGVRNTVLANVYTQRREATAPGQAGAGDFAQTPNTRQNGTSLLWSLRITGQTTSNVHVGYTRSEFTSTNRDDNLKFIRLGLTRRFDPRVSGSLSYRRLENDSSQGASSYTENAVTAGLVLRY